MNDIQTLIAISGVILVLCVVILVLVRRLLWIEQRHNNKLKIEAKLHFIINKLDNMPTKEDYQALKDQLVSSNAKTDKVIADIQRLHAKIDSIEGEAPTPEEWNAIKDESTALNNKLQGADDLTPEDQAGTGEGNG